MGCETIINELVRRGITYFIISPGSRSTLLTLAVARHPETTHVIAYDERGAAYHAVGYARATAKPAVLICTSGTAAANYLPAIAEASNDAIPLIAITADRPPELHDMGSNQTMNQQNLYGSFVRTFTNLEPEDLDAAEAPETMGAAIDSCLSPLPGPIHINCMLREPFQTDPPCAAPLPKEPAQPAPIQLDKQALSQLLEIASTAKRGMLIAGHLTSPEARIAVCALADALGWPLWADIRSGLHHKERFIQDTCALTQLIAQPSDSPPDVIIHFGGSLVSKALLDYLKHQFTGAYIRAAGDIRTLDPTGRATLSVNGRIPAIFNAFCAYAGKTLSRSTLILEPQNTQALLASKLEALAHKSSALSEPAIGYLLSQHLRHDIGLFLGNSMPVRFCDRFAIGNQLPEAISANRGVSGIDGTIATAAGYCAGLDATTVCLLGDISFIHDINSLSLLRNMSKPMILIVVNNSGGGIFHHLPISDQDDVFEEFFVTPHNYQFKHAAQQFQIPYSRAATNGEFIEQLQTAIASNAHALIELTVDQRSNMKVWRECDTLWDANRGQ